MPSLPIKVQPLTRRKTWSALAAHLKQARNLHLRDLFAEDPKRGEDGPTHQLIEHLASLRAVPGLVTLRPGDANEVVDAYRYAMKLRHQPTVLVLSRQPLPTLDRSKYAPASGTSKGAYVLADAPNGKPEIILIASGSEVILTIQAHEKLLMDGIRSRVVSMPSWDLFEHQSREYQESVLPPEVEARIAVEQASTFGWERYVGAKGRVIGMRTFGASAPLKDLQRKFGFKPDQVVAVAREMLRKEATVGYPTSIWADKASAPAAEVQPEMTPA